jgi:DNA-binding transcriptional ArsR family regulator
VEIGPDIASVAGLMGDPVRAAMLAALVDGRALPAGELAFLGNVAPQTASFHLGKLMDADLIRVERQGKFNYYRLASGAVASALESLAALAPVQRTRPETAMVKELCHARSCYKHLAGALAVQINQALLARGFIIVEPDRNYCLAEPGQQWFRDLGVHAARGRACLDWTERRHHLGGPLGVALFSRLKELGWLAANSKTRAVRVTHTGMRELHRQLGIAT